MPNFTSAQFVPQISLSSSTQTFEAGKFDNAFIKSLNLDIGITDNPTSINIGLINEVGRYRDYGADGALNYLDRYLLNIGNDINIWCYLVSQKKSTSSDGKTTELEFVDGSHILDRVFVGGVGVHVTPDPDQGFAINQEVYADIPVACPPCYSNQIIATLDPNHKEIYTGSSTNWPAADTRPNFVSIPDAFTRRILRASTKSVIGNWSEGGYIFLGDEKFTKTSCEIAQVDYSFQDLKDACLKMGITIHIEDKSYLPDKNIYTLRKSHWGSLREVLKSWCADFGISFFYDYTQETPNIHEIDLGEKILSQQILHISSLAKTIKAGSTSIVESIDEDKTIKGSFKNNVITTYKRPRVKRNFNKNTFYGTAYKCFQTTDILSEAARSYRTGYEFNTSCYLAKYNQNARTLWLSGLANQRYKAGNGKMFQALGFTPISTLSDALKNEIIDECLNMETYREIIKNFTATGSGITGFDMILGSYSSELASKHAEFEKSFAEDFLGKWFFTNLDSYADSKYGGWQQCFTAADWRYKIESSFTPEPEPIATSQEAVANATSLQARIYNQQKLPFAKNTWGAIPKNFWTFYDWFSDSRLKVFQRGDAPWNVTQEQVDRVFTDPENGENTSSSTGENGQIDLTLPFLPRFQKIAGMIETRLRARFGGTQIPIPQVIDGIKEKTVPCIMIMPTAERIDQILKVSVMTSGFNAAETPWYFSKDKSMGNKPSCDNSLLCEIQEGLDKFICAPETICKGYGELPPASVTTSFVGKIYNARDNQPFPEGVISQQGGGIRINFRPPLKGTHPQAQFYSEVGPPRVIDIVGPAGTFQNINDIYLANYKETITSDFYSPKIEQFLGVGSLSSPKNVSEVKLTLNNVSANDPLFAAIDPNGNIGVQTNIYIHGEGYLTLEQYHNYIASLSDYGLEGDIKHDLSVTFGNIDFGTLGPYLNASFGLNKLSCSIGSNGVTTSASWTNRPSSPPSTDLFTQEIEPQLMAKTNLI